MAVSIHHTWLRTLAVEMYRICNGMAPTVVTELFSLGSESSYKLLDTFNTKQNIWNKVKKSGKIG